MARQRNPSDAVQFTYESAQRIANVVRAAETTPPSASPLTFDRRIDGRMPKQVRAATFSGSWFAGSSKVVTFTNQPTTTVTVQNLTMVLPFTATQSCIVGRDGTAWYLVSAVDQQVKRGTFTAPWTKATNKTVTLLSGQQVTAVNDYVTISTSGTKKCTVGRDGTVWHLIAAECS
jgi:hypothetical protein